MCIAIPGQLLAISGPDQLFAEVELLGTRRTVNIALVAGSVGVGDWILVHAGSAIGPIDAAEAREVLALLAQIAPEPVAH